MPREYRATAKPGGRAPHVALSGGRSTLDLFGPGFTLLRTDTCEDSPDPSPLVEAARQRGMPLRLESAPEAAEAYARRLTLVRPDGFVAWRADELPDAPGAVLDVVSGW